MMPQMSVLPSRPLATNTSGGSQPVAFRSATSTSSNFVMCLPSGGSPQLMHRRQVNARIGVDEVLPRRRILNRMRPIAIGQGNKIAAVEVDSIVVEEIRVLAGDLAAGPEPDLSFVLVNAFNGADDKVALGDLVLHLAGLVVDQIEVTPAVFFRCVDQFIRLRQPGDDSEIHILCVGGPDECLRLLVDYVSRGPGDGIDFDEPQAALMAARSIFS